MFLNLCLTLLPFKKRELGLVNVVEKIIRDSKNAVDKEGKYKFYIIWKMHKAADASGLRSRPIAAATIDHWSRHSLPTAGIGLRPLAVVPSRLMRVPGVGCAHWLSHCSADAGAGSGLRPLAVALLA